MQSNKRRVDQLLVERGLAESRHKAQALLLAGQVLVNEQKTDKPGRMVDVESNLRILGRIPFASRAGAKLQAALDHFRINVQGRICADLGASTGGFTDCLLQYGAAAVHAYDVGTGLLDWKLKTDSRVVTHENFNVRYLSGADLPDGISLVTADLSFISLTKIIPPLHDALLAKSSSRGRSPSNLTIDVILLVKPQFEVGKGEVGKGGIVRDAAKQRQAVEGIAAVAAGLGFRRLGDLLSPVAGAEGNREFLLYLQLVPV